jgi:hypothetical protein
MAFKDPEKRRAYGRAYREANREKLKANRDANRERINALHRAWHAAHPGMRRIHYETWKAKKAAQEQIEME